MSNDLTELTATELDAVSGGSHTDVVTVNLGNIVPQVNLNYQSAAVLGNGNITQSNSGSNSISDSTFNSGGNSGFSFGSFSLN
jgi:hypothetical protein